MSDIDDDDTHESTNQNDAHGSANEEDAHESVKDDGTHVSKKNDTTNDKPKLEDINYGLSLDTKNANTRTDWERPRKGFASDNYIVKALAYWKDQDNILDHLASDPDIPIGEFATEYEWAPVRPLGKGGYGLAALWQCRCIEDGRIERQVVIKEQDRHSGNMLNEGDDPGRSYEAAIMEELNKSDNPNILRLQAYKEHTTQSRSRYYWEYAPCGDLHNLKNLYRAWNTYFPERFLWHVLLGLARAQQTLVEEPSKSRAQAFESIYRWQKNPGLYNRFIVHFDLKLQNIFLSEQSQDAHGTCQFYPTIKMADFGLAQVTSEDPSDPENPMDHRWRGTTGWTPPVGNFQFPAGSHEC